MGSGFDDCRMAAQKASNMKVERLENYCERSGLNILQTSTYFALLRLVLLSVPHCAQLNQLLPEYCQRSIDTGDVAALTISPC